MKDYFDQGDVAAMADLPPGYVIKIHSEDEIPWGLTKYSRWYFSQNSVELMDRCKKNHANLR